ncbi:MAG: hypothetical protein KGL39_52910, partial [Patescibacteria group bacterium]|nr:hypothetical protein [Patescibacteria group bacterium]
MAATIAYSQCYTNSLDAAIQQQIQMSLKNQAVAVYNEASTTAGHPARAAFANRVLLGSVIWSELIASVAAQGVTSTSTDAQVDTVVASL